MAAAAPGALSLADQVRDSLLHRTICHARLVSPFYAQRLRRLRSVRRFRLVDLPRLPLLTKSELTNNYDAICRPMGPPQFIMYTSGTESRELLVPVAPEEIAAGEKYFSDISPADAKKALSLSLVRVGHGAQWFSPNVPTIPAHTTFGPEQVMSLLGRRYSFPGVDDRITVIEGNLLTLRSLTSQLKALRIDGSKFGIKAVLTTGWYLTARQRKEFEAFWSATVVDRYGVTEVNGDAKQCPKCGKFHFDPVVIPETIHPITKTPISDGIGSIVLTGLWPFNQVAPKIRYEIADVVSVNRTSACGVADPAFEFLGRYSQTLHLIEGEDIRYLLFPTEIADVLDERYETVRRPQTGFLNFRSRLVAGAKRKCIAIEVEWNGRRRGAEDDILVRLTARSAQLRRALRDQICDIRVRFCEAGSLDRIHKV